MRRKIQAEELHAARSGREQTRKHLDGGGFTGAVGTEETKELSGGDGEIDAVDGGEFAEVARKFLGGNSRSSHYDPYGQGNSSTTVAGTKRAAIDMDDWL